MRLWNVVIALAIGLTWPILSSVASADESIPLERARVQGDRSAQRTRAWQTFATLVDGASSGAALVEDLYSERRTFDVTDANDPDPFILSPTTADAEIPLLTFVHFNEAAYRHIRKYKLYSASRLRTLATQGEMDTLSGLRVVPGFPDSAMVVKTGWWPVAGTGATLIPIWDPELNPPSSLGNPPRSWHRVLRILPDSTQIPPASPEVLMGRRIEPAGDVPLNRFPSVRVTAAIAAQIGNDRVSSTLVREVVGRPLREGDYLVLVAIHIATRELPRWIWTTLWWHDHPEVGPAAEGRPTTVAFPWNHFLMNVAFDDQLPLEGDGTPAIVFNPWFEARFADAGMGPGSTSNCVNCHARASYPPVDFATVLRGGALLESDPAFAPGRVRTSFLWSLALMAR